MKRVMCVSMALILAALCVMLVGLRAREESAPAAQRPVLLLTQEDTGAYFMQLRQGILKALDEQNCTLSTQIAEPAAMTDALWGGIEYRGVLIYIQDEALRRQALRSARGQGLPAALIDAHEEGVPSVEQDGAQFAALASGAAAKAERVLCLGGGEALRKATRSALRSRWLDAQSVDPDADFCAVIALDEEAAARLVREKAEGLWTQPLILVNPGEGAASWLESGQVQAAVLPSPYATGYIAASQALWSENAQKYRAPAFIVTPENMYDAQNVKLVFPLLY